MHGAAISVWNLLRHSTISATDSGTFVFSALESAGIGRLASTF